MRVGACAIHPRNDCTPSFTEQDVLFRWLVDEEVLARNPAQRLQKPLGEKRWAFGTTP